MAVPATMERRVGPGWEGQLTTNHFGHFMLAVIGADFKTPAQGAATGLWAATSLLLDGRGGLYLEDCDVARISAPDQPMDDDGVRAYAIDPDEATRLWDLSVATTGATPIPR